MAVTCIFRLLVFRVLASKHRDPFNLVPTYTLENIQPSFT